MKKELDSDFEEANKLLTSARNIYFLGFAYHDENLRRLDLSALPPISQALDQSNEVNIRRHSLWYRCSEEKTR